MFRQFYIVVNAARHDFWTLTSLVCYVTSMAFGLAPYRFEPTGHGCELSTGDDISASVQNIYTQQGHRTNVMLRGSSLLAKMLRRRCGVLEASCDTSQRD